MKLWDKGYSLDQQAELFMTGDDPTLDLALIPYDCLGSIAHAKMLQKIGVLSEKELNDLHQGLQGIYLDPGFSIQQEEEDVHTAVENALGDIGKKLHTGRSRNDQVLLDMRLWMRDQILQVSQLVIEACTALVAFAHKYHKVPIPGRTHFQRAMPSSAGLWAGAFLESLLDDLEQLQSAFHLINQCPLGSAASYGVNLPIDRQFVSDLLGFRIVQNNVLYANNSRGKFEGAVLHCLVQIMSSLAKASTDIILFSAPEFAYFSLPEKLCPGSSMMPQKRNPCPLELIRAKSAYLQSNMLHVLETVRALPSGYNRDFQETKRPVMDGIKTTLGSLNVFKLIIEGLGINEKACLEAFSSELFATDAALNLSASGVPFREAYRQIASTLSEVDMEDPTENILKKKHLGATGCLGLNLSESRIQVIQGWIDSEINKWSRLKQNLLQT